MHDGDIDYSGYTLRELEEVLAQINPTKYPKNYANVCSAYEALTSTPPPTKQSPPSTVEAAPPKVAIPRPGYMFLDWRGRISRKSFWVFGLLPTALLVIAESTVTESRPLPYWILLLASLVFSVAIDIKRCHDLNRSGWFTLLLLVPFLNVWPFVELGFLPGTAAPNKYGPPAIW